MAGNGENAAYSIAVCVFAAACLGDLATYLTTALQLALAFPDPHSGLLGAFAKFAFNLDGTAHEIQQLLGNG